MPIGEDFIVFATDSTLPGEGRILNPLLSWQSFYWIASPYDGRGLSTNSDASVMNEGVIISDPRNPHVLTVEHLADIAERAGIEVGMNIQIQR